MAEGRPAGGIECEQSEEAAATVAELYRADPDAIGDLSDHAVLDAAMASNDAELLSFIVNGGWTPDEPPIDVSAIRLRLMRLYLRADRLNDAREVAQAMVVNGATAIASVAILHADKAFSPIISADPQAFEFEQVTAWQLGNARQAAEADPNALVAQVRYGEALLTHNRRDEAQAVVDVILARVGAAAPDAPAYHDQADQLNWVYNLQARIAEARGDYAAALSAMERGAEIATTDVVSQHLNRAIMLLDQDLATEALAEVAGFSDENASPYGEMVHRVVLVCAAAQLGDRPRVTQLMGEVREQAERFSPLAIDAAHCAGDDAFAAATYIASLSNPDRRGGAILSAQNYADDADPRPPGKARSDARFRAMLARNDVRRAVDRVAHVRSFPIRRP